ncbi:hypothetical protein ACQP00_01165 [Dactylosporangium sp. CS-047395]|uniref:hypothetical protein n=1 Tax=Dactylosporangium sp. CS-047395 TaxID=3239936 RepID=UPI003D8B2328
MLAAMTAKMSAVDSAGAAVRAVARGEPVPELREGTELIGVVHDGDLVRVTVRRQVPTPIFEGFYVEETAVAMAEPRAAGGP